MRRLTITRTKSFVGSLVSVKIYVEDAFHNELMINGIPCRKLGEIKNGETQTFSIDNEAVKVFAVAGTVSRNYCYDYYPVPAGEADVILSGKNHFHPGAGNPFRFDGVTDETVLASRKKGSRVGTVIFVAALVVGILLGLANVFLGDYLDSQPKDFSNDGMSITLTAEFEAMEYEGFTQCYEGKLAAVLALKEEFSLAPVLKDYSAEDYGRLVLRGNGMDEKDLVVTEDLVYFTYVRPVENGKEYFYLAAVYRGSDAFWLIQFAAPETLREDYEPLFLQWAASVTVE